MSPFATHAGNIARRLEDGGHHGFVGGLEEIAAVVARHAGVKGVPSGHEQRTRRTTKRRGIAMFEAQTTFGEGVEIRCLEVVGAIATDVADAEVVGENEDDVRFSRNGMGETSKQGEETSAQDRFNFHNISVSVPRGPTIRRYYEGLVTRDNHFWCGG